jgi:CHAT domain-containing protein
MVRCVVLATLQVAAVCLVANSAAAAAQDVATFRAQREAYIDQFRRTGARPPEPARTLESQLSAALDAAPSGDRSALLYELASVRRIQGQFEDAIRIYQAAIDDASGHGDVVFDAWIGIARSHIYGTNDHGAAADAYQHAVEVAGPNPSRKQRYELVTYATELHQETGELDFALVSALKENILAESDSDRYYSQTNVGSVLEDMAQRCDYRKLVDSKTVSRDDVDGWGACRRAVASSSAWYLKSFSTAERLGWNFLRAQTGESIDRVNLRLLFIEQKAASEASAVLEVFKAEDSSAVLVNESFDVGGSGLGSTLGKSIAESVAAHGEREDARKYYLSALKADIDGDPQAALANLKHAVRLLEEERTSLFDLRQRGTVIEGRPEFARDLALRLLAQGEYDEAFATFEAFRARGLSNLAAVFEAQDLSDDERHWLGRLVDLESQEGAILNRIVESTIAGEAVRDLEQELGRLDLVRAERNALAAAPEYTGTIAWLQSSHARPKGLMDLRELVKATGIPVMLYWVAQTNVIVWAISPESMEVKTVFLPEAVVVDKVRRIMNSTTKQRFDATAARQLYAYLIQPFERHLVGREVIVVPQGPLVSLPFEALMNARTGEFLVEKVAVSYAPSAGFAAKALQRDSMLLPPVTAVYDEWLDLDTGEIQRLRGVLTTGLHAFPTQKLSAEDVIKAVGGKRAVHVLLHGFFERDDPLQSRLDLNNDDVSPEKSALTAAELLASDWRDARIVVFSSCESAEMNVRISNEIYGLSWAPLVGGADTVVMSRWRVEGSSNADWMEEFYRRLTAGAGSPAVAAAETMRWMIGDGRWSEPYYWAAPQVFGR